jgi:hypothetical protein
MKYLITIILLFITIMSYAQTPQLNKINENLFKSNPNMNMVFDYSYNFGNTTVNGNNNTVIVNSNVNIVQQNTQTIDFIFNMDYSTLYNLNPSQGIRNNPNNNLYRINTVNDLNYVGKIIK